MGFILSRLLPSSLPLLPSPQQLLCLLLFLVHRHYSHHSFVHCVASVARDDFVMPRLTRVLIVMMWISAAWMS